MKRSEINAALKEMEQMIREYRFAIPPFCNFTSEEWKEKGHDYAGTSQTTVSGILIKSGSP